MYTLPGKTRITIRRPGKPLVAFVESVFASTRGGRTPFKHDRLYVELTNWVTREPDAWNRRVYTWYSFASGESTPIYESPGAFEIEPAYALFMSRLGDVTIYLSTFAEDPEAVVALDVARDAILEGRNDVGTRIARSALPHGHVLYLALVHKEKNLL